MRHPSGAPIRSPVSEEEVSQYRMELLKKKGKEKMLAESHQDEDADEVDKMVTDEQPSPSTALSQPLQELTLGPSDSQRFSPGSSTRSKSGAPPEHAAAAATTTATSTSTMPTTAAATRLTTTAAASPRHPKAAVPSSSKLSVDNRRYFDRIHWILSAC